jgi:hypothetical protein
MIITQIRLTILMLLLSFATSRPGLGQQIEPDHDAKPLTWQQSLPADVQASVLWCADHEEGTLHDWEYDRNPDNNGGGLFTTGTSDEAMAEIDSAESFTGKYCAKTTIRCAFMHQNGAKAVRLMRWTDKPWDQGGQFFPKSAYYGVWMRLDKNYSTLGSDSSSSGWWNVFQFKSNDKSGQSQPVWVLNVGNDRESGKMQFYLYSDINQPASISQDVPVPLPVGRWFHLEVLYEQSTDGLPNGSITVWQNGQRILSAANVKTVLAGHVVWGVGNYTDHITGGDQPGSATIYFDDATVASKPTHPYVQKMAPNQPPRQTNSKD